MADIVLKEISSVIRSAKNVWTDLSRKVVRITVRAFIVAMGVLLACVAFTSIGYGFHKAALSKPYRLQKSYPANVVAYRMITERSVPRINLPPRVIKQRSFDLNDAHKFFREVRRMARAATYLRP